MTSDSSVNVRISHSTQTRTRTNTNPNTQMAQKPMHSKHRIGYHIYEKGHFVPGLFGNKLGASAP